MYESYDKLVSSDVEPASKKAVVRIGTSNVVVPGNKNTFPEEFQTKSRLNFYAHHFNTVEINRSFYKIPLYSTYEKWCNDVPDEFEFSLKLNQEVTHQKNLPTAFPIMKNFMHAARGIGDKKGCLLVQFPGSITFDYFSTVEKIFKQLQSEDPEHEWKKAVEFRSNSWYVGETREMLSYYGLTAVLHDFPKGKMMEPFDKSSFVYLRFHGPTGDYSGDYSESVLKDTASSIEKWLKDGKDVYVYFNNTIGCAYQNATSLRSMVEHSAQ